MRKRFCDAKLLECLLIVCLMFLNMLVVGVPIVSSEGNNGNSNWCDIWDFDDPVDFVEFAITYNGTIEVIVGVKDETSYDELTSFVEENGGTVVDAIFIQGTPIAIIVDVSIDSFGSFVDQLEASGLPMYVEPNIKIEALRVPNDPYWSNQWGPRKIEADYAWNTTTGDSSVLVAVIDTGIDYNHPDLVDNYVELGYDWVNNDDYPMDDHGHGTHCAGIIAGVIDNNEGIAGVAQVRMLAEKVLNENGEGSLENLAKAIIHATDQNANIISMSLGSIKRHTTLHQAIKYAYDTGVLLVAAAGNTGFRNRGYPAFNEEVVAVTATDENDEPAEFTTYGNWVEFSAPGVNIYSTFLNNSYKYANGTSMATPHVAGVAALALSQFPTLSVDQLRYYLRYTADDLGELGFDVYYGYGRINARKAVEQGQPDHDLILMRWSNKLDEVGLVGINATVLNFGVNLESNIRVDMMVNGNLWDTRYISSLPSGAKANVFWLWWREPGKLYNLSVQVVPKPSEIDTENNKDWSWLFPEATTIRVPYDYPTIEDAVGAASPGNTILVAPGQYPESVYLDKTGISLIGENRWNTIIDGQRKSPVGIYVQADEAYVSKFTVRNSSLRPRSLSAGIHIDGFDATITDTNVVDNLYGIYLWSSGNTIIRNRIAYNVMPLVAYLSSNDNTISENLVRSNYYGITLVLNRNNDVSNNLVTQTYWYSGIVLAASHNNRIIGNLLLSNYGAGYWNSIPEYIQKFSVCIGNSRDNLFKHNYLRDNTYGIAVYVNRDNRLYHNNFLYNTVKLFVYYSPDDIWHNRWACEGNYWSDYEGEDQDGDGVGDTNLPHLQVDSHPLMSPWYPADVNHDGIATILDIVIISVAYGSHPGDPKWNPHADLNEDGVIDISDINIVSAEFGETWMTYWEKPLEVLAEDQHGNPLTMEVWIDEEFVGYTGTSFDVLRGPHEVWVKETYTFSHWEDTSTENPRILIIDSAKTVTAYFDK
jgi:thermitase